MIVRNDLVYTQGYSRRYSGAVPEIERSNSRGKYATDPQDSDSETGFRDSGEGDIPVLAVEFLPPSAETDFYFAGTREQAQQNGEPFIVDIDLRPTATLVAISQTQKDQTYQSDLGKKALFALPRYGNFSIYA